MENINQILSKISYGVYIISSVSNGKYNGQIANVAFQVTSDPIVFAISINKQNLTHSYINLSKIFSISVLSQDVPMQFIGHFGFRSGRDFDKFDGINYKIGKTKLPVVLDSTVAALEMKVINQIDVITHTVFFGKLYDAELIANKQSLTYDYYHKVIKGKTPKKAPTYLKP